MKTFEDGSLTAKRGFANENFVIDAFNQWQTNIYAQDWLNTMNYHLSDIESIEAVKVKGSYKADIQVQVTLIIKTKTAIDYQNISIKLVSNSNGFNQIDKRWVDKYSELWQIPHSILYSLKLYTGELSPLSETTRDQRRTFLDELPQENQQEIIDFFTLNKTLIISDLLKGRGQFAAEWLLVVSKTSVDMQSKIFAMNIVLNYYAQGETLITPQGNLKIGRISMQRKGGDNGRKTANMLQFKMNPADILRYSNTP
jgi:hypothetical protein